MSADVAGQPNPANFDWVEITQTGGQWAPLIVPRNAGLVSLVTIGNGAGGGGGFSGASLTQRGGGGGGGSGGISSLLIFARYLSRELQCLVPGPAAGGAAGVAGTAGAITYVAIAQNINAPNVVLQSGGAGATGGGAGLGGGPSAGGTGQTAAANTIWTRQGSPNFAAGDTGVGGSANGSASNRVWGFALPLSCGSGGAGVTAGNVTGTGGYIAAAGPYADLLGGQTAGADGQNGFPLDSGSMPWASIGGSGGASNGTGPGGRGGNGWIGSGGGGGGGGNGGGAGGAGGPGIVLVGFA